MKWPNRQKSHNRKFTALSIALAAVVAASAAPVAWAGPEIPFSEAQIFFELNDTDGDLGIHSSIDGEPWQMLEIEDPSERVILDVMPSGRLAKQGMTQLFFESAEPSFDELPPAEFFKRFPAGRYEISGITLEGDEMESTAVLSHVLPAPPGNVRVSGIAAAINCDAALPAVRKPVVISWSAVTASHPTIGKAGPLQVSRYQVFAELRTAPFHKFSLDLPPNVTRFTVPAELADRARDLKFEIQVRGVNGNQTAIESCFTIR
ncbi:hypothetical protein [Lysobacter koreensis]